MAVRLQQLRDLPQNERGAFLLVGLAAVVWWLVFSNLQALADVLTYDLIGLDGDSHLGQSVNFFVYDVPKILLLLTGMVNIGVLMLTQNNMMRVAQNAARNLALAVMTEAETETYIQTKLANLGASLVVDAVLPDTSAVPPETDVTVSVSIPMADVLAIDIVGMKSLNVFKTGSLQTQVTMRQEVPQ